MIYGIIDLYKCPICNKVIKDRTEIDCSPWLHVHNMCEIRNGLDLPYKLCDDPSSDHIGVAYYIGSMSEMKGDNE